MNTRLMRTFYHPSVIVPLLVVSRLMVERDFNLAAVVWSLAVFGLVRLWNSALARLER